MKQAMPALHPAMTGETPPEARDYFDKDTRDKFKALLVDGLPSDHPPTLTRALDQISIYCWRYEHHWEYEDYPESALQRKNAKATYYWANELRASLKKLDAQTTKRIVLNLGMRDAGKCPRYMDPRFEPFIDERLDSGERRLDRFITALADFVEAAELAKARKPPWKMSRRGLKAIMTPRLERSLAHALANVWCEFRQEDFLAPNKEKRVTPKFRGIAFVQAILAELKVRFPGKVDRLALFAVVRSERYKAGKESKDEQSTREKSGNANRRFHKRRRRAAAATT